MVTHRVGQAQCTCRGLWAFVHASGTFVRSRCVHRLHCFARRLMPQPLAPSARQGTYGRGLDHGAPLHTACTTATVLQEGNELALGLRVPLDVALRHGEAGMAGELLHVPETAPDLRDFARGAGNEGAAPRMG